MNSERRSKSPRKARSKKLRVATVVGVLAVYSVGIAFHTGLGSLSAFGVGDIAAVCPVGALETMIAGRVLLPLPLAAVAVAVLAAVFLGRAFCGWVCPVPLARKLVTNKDERDHFEKDRKQGVRREALKRSAPSLGVLGVVLASTAVFGFPVFCLVCPVGLVFATVLAVIRLVAYNELVVDLLVFPALIVVELVLLKKWCSTLCPIGALLGLLSRFNKTFVPTVDPTKCLADAGGSSCDACNRACSSDIDLVRGTGSGSLHDCTKCKECAAHCPVDAITFPWRVKGEAGQKDNG